MAEYVYKIIFTAGRGIIEEAGTGRKKSAAWSKIGEAEENEEYTDAFERGYGKYMEMQRCLAEYAKEQGDPIPLDLEPILWNDGHSETEWSGSVL